MVQQGPAIVVQVTTTPPDRSWRWRIPLVAIMAWLALPSLYLPVDVGLDPSWSLGMHLLVEKGLVLGRDVHFTYGPFGWLLIPLGSTPSLYLSSVWSLVILHLATFAALGLWLDARRFGMAASALALLPLVAWPFPTDYLLPSICFFLGATCFIDSQRGISWRALLVGLLGALGLTIKISTAVVALGIGGVFGLIALHQRRWKLAVGLLGGLIFGLVIDLLAYGGPTALVDGLRIGLEIGAVHASGMMRGGPQWQLWIALLGLIAVVVALLGSKRPPIELLACLPMLLLGLRHGFMRQQTHVAIGFSVALALSVWSALSAQDRRRQLILGTAAAIFASALIGVRGLEISRLITPHSRVAEVSRQLGELRQDGHRDRRRAELLDKLEIDPALIELLVGREVDVLTTEISAIEALDLRWKPRPVLGSYAAASPRLDSIEAEHFRDEGPERLLVELFGLDTRHPVLDQPRTWTVLLESYSPLHAKGRWMVLQRRTQPLRLQWRRIGEQIVAPGEEFPYPQSIASPTAVSFQITYSLLGRLAAGLWKLPELRIALDPLEPRPRRIVPGVVDVPAPPFFPLPASGPATLQAWEQLELGRWPVPQRGILVTGGAWAWKELRVISWEAELALPP